MNTMLSDSDIDLHFNATPPPVCSRLVIRALQPIYAHDDPRLMRVAPGIRWDAYARPSLDAPPRGEPCDARCKRLNPRRLVQHDLRLYNVSAAGTCGRASVYEDAGQAPVVVVFHGIVGPRGIALNDTHSLQSDFTWHARRGDTWWKVIISRSATTHYRELLSCVQIFSHAYYHLVTETLPRILLGAGMLVRRPGTRLLLARAPRVAEYLALLGIAEERVVWYDNQLSYSADILYVPRAILVGIMHRETARMLRVALECNNATPMRGSVLRVVYVHRAEGARYLDNHVELEDGLRSWLPGSEIVKLTGSESIVLTRDIMRNASVVIGPHGAGLAHIVFAPASATLIEVMMAVDTNMCFWNLATAIGMRHVLITSKGRSSSDNLHIDNMEYVRAAVMHAVLSTEGPAFPCS